MTPVNPSRPHACNHLSSQHRRKGNGRCLVPDCKCDFGPGPVPRSSFIPPRARPARGTATVDGSGIVVAFKPPEREPARRKLENMLWSRLAEAGLPEPQKEYRFAKPEGRMFRADGFYPPDLLIEVDGGVFMPGGGRHTRGSGFSDDCEKLNIATVLGYRVLRFTKDMIRSGMAVEHIRRALERHAPPLQMPLTGGSIVDAG